MGAISRDIKKECTDLVKHMTEIAKLLQDDENNSQSGQGGDNQQSQQNQQDNSNNSNQEENKNQNSKSNKKNSSGSNDTQQNNSQDSQQDQNNSQTGQGGEDDLDNELSKAFNDLVNELNKKEGQGQGEGNQQDQQNQNGQNNNEFNFRGQQIQNKVPMDIRQGTDDAGRTESEMNRNIDDLVKRAASMSEKAMGSGAGSSSCGLKRHWEMLVKPEPPKWISLLNPFLRPSNTVNWTWNKSHQNRLTRLNQGQILFRGAVRPKEKLKDLCVAFDNSGSIAETDFNRFYSEMAGFLQLRKNVQGWACWWDTAVNEKAQGEFKNYRELINIQPYGGGGTDPICALDYAEKHKCKYVIIFTDGEFYTSNEEIQKWKEKFTKVLWVLNNKENFERFTPPFGEKCV